MTEIVTIGGSTASSYSGQVLNIVSGAPTINGSSDTVQSAASGIGITLTGGNDAINLTGSFDTLMAGLATGGGVTGDTLLLNGNDNVISDNGFSDGGVTINGSYNNFSSQQRIETSNIVVNGNHDTVSAIYMNGNFVVNGNDVVVFANNGNFTVNGVNDTVIAANAQSILVAGSGDTVVDEANPGSNLPTALLAGANAAGQDTTPGTAITVTGAGANVTTYNNNNTVTSSGDSSSISLQSYGNSATVSGGNSSVAAQSTTETVSVAGANSTVSTSTSILTDSVSSTVPASTVTVDSVVASTTTYNDGSSSIVDTTPGSGASTVNVTSGGTSVVATGGGTYNDSVGSNNYTIGGGTKLDLSSGDNTVSVANGEMLTQDTLGGTASAPNTVILGSGSVINFTSAGTTSNHDVISVTGSDNSGFIYGSSQDTLYAGGSGNLFAVVNNPSVSSSTGSVLVVSGADTLSIWSGNNSIQATNGATLFVNSDNNSITGSNASLTLQGTGNRINFSGEDTVSDASPWAYETAIGAGSVQNQFTVAGGQFNLGGQDTLLQTGSSAALTLAGGNNVNLWGANDSITAYDQVYGGNNIVLNGANDSVNLVNVSDSAATINANVDAFVTATDSHGAKIGGINNNSNEQLVFIGGSNTSNTVIAAGSNTQVTLFGGSSSNNIVSGGDAGNNSLNGGVGGGDLFTAGGNNDVLIGGLAGANTLVSAAGNETLTGAGRGNDLFSITGGGGTDMITDFIGSLVVAANLTISNESVSGGALNVYLNDGTHLIFAGLTSVSQTGNVFTH